MNKNMLFFIALFFNFSFFAMQDLESWTSYPLEKLAIFDAVVFDQSIDNQAEDTVKMSIKINEKIKSSEKRLDRKNNTLIFSCPKCDFETTKQAGLSIHMTKVHTARANNTHCSSIFTCKECSKQYILKDSLRKHRWRKHKNNGGDGS